MAQRHISTVIAEILRPFEPPLASRPELPAGVSWAGDRADGTWVAESAKFPQGLSVEVFPGESFADAYARAKADFDDLVARRNAVRRDRVDRPVICASCTQRAAVGSYQNRPLCDACEQEVICDEDDRQRAGGAT